jgi:hypothetical protein
MDDRPLATPARDARELAEQLAERLNAIIGTVRLELIFQDGRLVNGYRHDKFSAHSLEQILVTGAIRDAS